MKGRPSEDGTFLAVIAILYVLAMAGLIGYAYGRSELRRQQRIDRLESDVRRFSPKDTTLEELQAQGRRQFREDVAEGVVTGLVTAQQQGLKAAV